MEMRRITTSEHILNLFRISSLPEEERTYMSNAMLMDQDVGLLYDWFAEAQPDFDQDVMQRLLDRGWIRLDQKSDILTIHPLIYQIGGTELDSSGEPDCALGIEWFEKAANHPFLPSVRANQNLGEIYLGEFEPTRDYVSVDPQRALDYLLRAKALGAEDVDELIAKARELQNPES